MGWVVQNWFNIGNPDSWVLCLHSHRQETKCGSSHMQDGFQFSHERSHELDNCGLGIRSQVSQNGIQYRNIGNAGRDNHE